MGDCKGAAAIALPRLTQPLLLALSLRLCRSGLYFVAAERDDAEGWVDALLLLSHLLRTGGMAGVQAALSVRR